MKNEPIEVTLQLDQILAVAGLLEIASLLPEQGLARLSRTRAARTALADLRRALPAEMLGLVDDLAARAKQSLGQPIPDRLLAAAMASCECRN